MSINNHPAPSDSLKKVSLSQVPVVVQVKKLKRFVQVSVWADLWWCLVLQFMSQLFLESELRKKYVWMASYIFFWFWDWFQMLSTELLSLT